MKLNNLSVSAWARAMRSIHLRFELTCADKKKKKWEKKKKKFIHEHPKLQARCFLEVKYGGI